MDQLIGKTLGSCQILEQVGKGGMATIFRAYQPSMDRYVAVKILPSHFTEDETFVERFNQEARTLANLQHPFILPVHDYGEQEGITYLVMRYITAGTLKDLITQEGPLELSEAARIFDQIGRALGYAHSQGVIHRDIKPTNVLIDERRDAFLTDFGIAKLVAGTAQFTATGAIVGTPAYMSPEQGMAEPLDHRSDIYSLGVVLYEMVTGRVPFEAETPLAVLLKHVNASLPPPRQVKPDLPEPVERVILKAMAKAPADRFQQAEEMVEALQQAVAGLPTEIILPRPAVEPAQTISVPPEPLVAQEPLPETVIAAPPRKALPWLPIVGGVAALAVVIIAALLILPNLGGDEAPGEATSTAARLVAQATDGPATPSALPPAAAEPAATSTQPAVAAEPVATSMPPPAATEPAATSMAPADQHTIVFQYGAKPDHSYAGMADMILARDAEPNASLGGTEHLEIYFADAEAHRSLVRWDIAAVPAGITVHAATLELYRHSGDAAQDMELALYCVTRDWTEGTGSDYYPASEYVPDGATWLTATTGVAWTTPGGDYDTTSDYGHGPNGIVAKITLPAGPGEGWVQLDVTAAVRAWVEGSVPNYGLLLRPRSGEWTYHHYHSREYGAEELRPRLTVTYAAEPAPAAGQLPAGWTSYSNGNFVRALARQDEYLWVGSTGGLVRWNLDDGSYVKFGATDGLASGWINALLLDEQDDLWVATDNGLSRFNGETWLTFDELDGLDADEVIALFVDDDGALWAGTAYGERGLNYYDGSGWGPPPIPPLPLDFPRPRAFAMSEEVGLFVGLDEGGLAHFDGEEWQVLTSDDGLPGDQVYDLLLIDDEVLLASFDYEVVQFDLHTGAAEAVSQLSGIDVYCMYQADDGSLWFAGDEGAVRYDPETGDWQAFESRPGTIPNWPVTAIIEDDDGLWLGTDGGGTVFYDGSSWETWASDDGLGGNRVEAITQDGVGALWFVHGGSGLTRYDPAGDTWQTFGEDEGAIYWPSHPGVDGEGHLWIGEYGELEWYDGRAWQSFAPAADELAETSVYDLAFGPDDVLWLVTDSGLVRHDPANGEWTTFSAEDHPVLVDVYAFHVAGDGTVWVGGEEALIRYDGSGWSVPAASGDPPTYVSGIASAPDGGLWVVADGALYHLDGNQWHYYYRPDDGWIERVAVGPDGTVWVGYEGLGRFDPASGDWQVFTMDEGLVHWNVQAIYVTPAGVVWVGTAGGVSRYVPAE